jgi:hypothetical protein
MVQMQSRSSGENSKETVKPDPCLFSLPEILPDSLTLGKTRRAPSQQ